MNSYNKFLEKKLFLIEVLSLKEWLETKNGVLKKIHDICISSPSEVQSHLEGNPYDRKKT